MIPSNSRVQIFSILGVLKLDFTVAANLALHLTGGLSGLRSQISSSTLPPAGDRDVGRPQITQVALRAEK